MEDLGAGAGGGGWREVRFVPLWRWLLGARGGGAEGGQGALQHLI